jgi:hypothetical protein
MKKIMTHLILLVVPVFIISLPIALEAQAPLKLGILLPFTGPLAPWGHDIRTNIEQVAPRISNDLKLLYYDVGAEPTAISKLTSSFTPERIQLIIGPFLEETVATSVVRTMQSKEIITVLPIFSTQLIEFVKRYSANAYVIPEPTDQIILAIDQSVRKAGPANVSALKNTLMDEAKKAQEKAVAYQIQISREVMNAVGLWERERKIPVQPSAKEFLGMDYSSKFISFMIKFSAREKEFPELMKAVSKETNNILDQYWEFKKEKKGMMIPQVDLASFKESGVNGCEELPCKQHCCDKYKVRNVDDCFRIMGCK